MALVLTVTVVTGGLIALTNPITSKHQFYRLKQ
jgi:hypothetical protein